MAACSQKTKTDKPCRMTAQHGSDYCFIHDPERADESHQAKVRGGVASTTLKKTRRLVEADAKKVLAGIPLKLRRRHKKIRLSLRTLVRTLNDDVKRGLVEVLIKMAKADARWAELYGRYEGSLRQDGPAGDGPCHVVLTDLLRLEPVSQEDYDTLFDDIEAEQVTEPEESDEERRSRW